MIRALPLVCSLVGSLAYAGLLTGCDAGPDARAQWLQTTLVLDNQVFLDTDPAQAEAKFARMSLSLYAFFRGTMPQFARDLAEGGGAGRGYCGRVIRRSSRRIWRRRRRHRRTRSS